MKLYEPELKCVKHQLKPDIYAISFDSPGTQKKNLFQCLFQKKSKETHTKQCIIIIVLSIYVQSEISHD